MSYILGISAYYHDSAAVLLKSGQIIAAAQEERFSRIKHDAQFPRQAINYCLSVSHICISDLDYVCFYDKPLLKFERLLETYMAFAPLGIRSFITSMPVWLKDKLFLKSTIKKELKKLKRKKNDKVPPLLFNEHHQSHAASAFFPSPYSKAIILCLDGVGEWATTSTWLGDDNTLDPQWEIDFPHSLGLLYSAFTYYTGFKVNSGEYKLMGLAPYGQPKYTNLIMDNLIDIKVDGTYRLNMDFFSFATGLRMTSNKFHDLFKGEPRKPESEISQKEMDIAKSIQVVTEDIVMKLAKDLKKTYEMDSLCLAGGVALNCVANGKIKKSNIFKNIWVQPAAGDAGGALGAALTIWHTYLKNDRSLQKKDSMEGSYLGIEYDDLEIINCLKKLGAFYTEIDSAKLCSQVASLISDGNVIGWFQGRMEFGPRALGNRSILGDPRSPEMQSIMNLKIKHRESFRPFAPAVKADRVSEWFDVNGESPYMLFTSEVISSKRKKLSSEEEESSGFTKLKVARSEIPAVTHVDYSARIQTVNKTTNPRFYELLNEFDKLTGCPVLINTSFNVRGEPIVCSPEDAYHCFMRTGMDYLVIGNVLLNKKDQPDQQIDISWQKEFELD